MSKFSIDTFLQTAMGVNMNEDLKDIRSFENLPMVKHILKLLNPDPIAFLPMLIPGLGAVLDFLGLKLFGAEAFECRVVNLKLNQKLET